MINNDLQYDNISQKSIVKQWLKITVIAIANVLILAFMAAYFENQPMSLLGVISVIADSMGIVIGLLGIWFFFLSENLYRTTAINLEKTTSAVTELRDQMWDMIQKTFNTFVERENSENVAEARKAVEQLKEQIQNNENQVPSDLLNSIEIINNRINSLEQRDLLIRNRLEATSPSSKINLSDITEQKMKTIIINNIDNFPMKAGKLFAIIVEKLGKPTIRGAEFMRDIINLGYFIVLDDDDDPKAKVLHAKTMLGIDPFFLEKFPETILEIYNTRTKA